MADGRGAVQRNKTEDDITAEVLERFAATPDPRLRQIMLGLIGHLHAFVKEVELTEAEWFQAIEILTEAGKMCSDKRQEFILFSDTLGRFDGGRPDRPPQTRRRHRIDGVRAVPPARRAGDAGGRQHRPSRHDRRADAGQRPGARPRRQADRRRGARRLAGADQRALRFAGQEPRRTAHARQVPHRCRRPLPDPHGACRSTTRSRRTGRSARC